MGLFFELEMIESSMIAFNAAWWWCCLWNLHAFYVKNRADRPINFDMSLLRKMLRTMLDSCPRPILTLRIDWKGFWSL